MELGIVGLPRVGKTTLFNALSGSKEVHPSKGVHRAVVKVPDPRLERLAAVFASKRVTPATLEYLDFPGAEQKGLPSSLLGELRAVDALVHVVRAFENPRVPHVYETLHPLRDAQALEGELVLADLLVLEARLERLAKEVRATKNPLLLREQALLERCLPLLTNGTPLRELPLDHEEERLLRGFRFLSAKPLLIVINRGEENDEEKVLASFRDWTKKPKVGVLSLCATLEEELSRLSPEEAEAFRADLGLSESALSKMGGVSFSLLGLKTFFTGSEKEVRAWAVPAPTTALEAAGTIHSDMARGFIRCETIRWEELVAQGSYAKARSAGLLRLEGKDYLVRDGEVLLIRFSVSGLRSSESSRERNPERRS